MKQLLKVFGLMLMAIAVFSCEKEDPQPKESDLINIKLSTSVPNSARLTNSTTVLQKD
jgi:hypothetical protein